MVLGILTSIAACPAIIGTTEAVRQGQKQNSRQSHRGRKSNLLVSCSDPSRKARDIHGGSVVLRGNKVCRKVHSQDTRLMKVPKLFVTTVNPKYRHSHIDEGVDLEADEERLVERGHLFAGYFFPYPESKWGGRGDGYVSTISDDPPQLSKSAL
jgi:hypothetical protein